MSSKLRELLSRFRSVGSVELAAIVATDGLLIESTAQDGIDVDAICAVASNGLAMAESLGREIDKGGAVQTVLEYAQGLVVLEPIGNDAMLLIMVDARDDLGYVRFLAAKHRGELENALQEI
ncbi:roadblock/LC7 family protein [Oscillochloris trichoides DG-6]|uniref:Roadblock/LC7 family protein n=1 Tax=Oscillochloris trichoides DG-6 TaxID=765420 RepID=E1IA65_9CHLR|nr:roadblock/LC7 domain-containing protein [Oscillochloris trichoides]EFO81819.1 roadblock/LC7 family protein [Oscillochloris trichoides DG-6]